MKIRDATLEDISGILNIINDAILHTTAVYDYEIKTKEEQVEWFQQKMNKNMPVIIAEYESEVIGYGTFDYFRPRIGYKYTVEHSVYVAKGFQGKGVGKLVLEELIKIATKKGFHTMIAGIDAKNKGSIEFHKKFGFKEVGRLKEVGYKFNNWLDVVFMQRILLEKEN